MDAETLCEMQNAVQLRGGIPPAGSPRAELRVHELNLAPCSSQPRELGQVIGFPEPQSPHL